MAAVNADHTAVMVLTPHRQRGSAVGGGDVCDGGRWCSPTASAMRGELGEISLTRVWQSLRPLEGGAGDGGGGVCTRVGGT